MLLIRAVTKKLINKVYIPPTVRDGARLSHLEACDAPNDASPPHPQRAPLQVRRGGSGGRAPFDRGSERCGESRDAREISHSARGDAAAGSVSRDRLPDQGQKKPWYLFRSPHTHTYTVR